MLNNVDAARKPIEEAIRIGPQDPVTVTTHALVLWREGNIEKALQQLDSAIDISKYCGEAYYIRSKLRANSGDMDGAMEDSQRASELRYMPFLTYLFDELEQEPRR